MVTANSVTEYPTFTECHDHLQELKAADPDTYTYIPEGEALDVGIKVVTWFENKYTCSGICNTALFYYSLPLSEGIPDETCLTHLKQEIGDTMTYLGVAAVVIGVLAFLVFLVQYCLWCY